MSTVARVSPFSTVSPSATETFVTVPETANDTCSLTSGVRVPEVEMLLSRVSRLAIAVVVMVSSLEDAVAGTTTGSGADDDPPASAKVREGTAEVHDLLSTAQTARDA